MPLKLMYITNRTDVAKIAEDVGVDRIFVDLELIGKEKRQANFDTVISKHSVNDVRLLRSELTKAELLVRINPIYDNSEQEINEVIAAGADIIMLPYFKTVEEVKKFFEHVGGRVKTILLFETPESVEKIDEILAIPEINEVYIGLNDLHLGYKKKFMFELMANGTVDEICSHFKAKNLPFGVGGIARLGKGTLPSERIIAEHYRLGSGSAILSRSFCNVDKIDSIEKIQQIFSQGVKEIRDYEKTIEDKSPEFFRDNHETITQLVDVIVNRK
ncbi:MAG: aldolase/citrate lyase family protein [Bacillota bacterium]|nr:aldolase/citrate lyase family protein [Bacillota bacterium]